MEKITIEQCLNQTSCGEKLLAIIVAELKHMSEDFDNGESKKLKELYRVGNKLLTYDYYKEADKLAKELSKLEDGPTMLTDMLIESDRAKPVLEAKQLANIAKKADYTAFFNGLMDHIEEWC